MNRRVAVRAVVLHEGKLLCVRIKKYTGSITSSNSYWCLPGGGVDVGEPLLVAMEREMIEELGIKPVIGGLLYMQQFVHEGTEHLEFFYHVTNAADYLDIDLSATSHGAIEIDKAAFIDPAAEYVLPKFLSTEPLAEHAASVVSPKLFNEIS